MKMLELLNKDVVVLRFRYDEELHRVDSLLSVQNEPYAPPSLIDVSGHASLRNLVRWWARRSIPASRAQIDRLRSALSIDDTAELLEKSLALSLSDRYWVREEGSPLDWAGANFFDNAFSDDLGVITLDPSSSALGAALAEGDLMNPNSSVGGDLPKKWVIEDGTRYLVKNGIQLFGQDVFNEVVTTRLCARLLPAGDYVPYELVLGPNEALCRCPELLGPNEELVPVDDLLRRHANDPDYGTYLCVRRALAETGLAEGEIDEGLAKLFSVDFLMANCDRHTNNFGVIRDVETLRYKRLAPIFDTGFSLWCDKRSLRYGFDYDYSPRPFTNTADSPLHQLRLFDSFDWLDASALAGWPEEARAVLERDELIPPTRLDAIQQGVSVNVRAFLAHVEQARRR